MYLASSVPTPTSQFDKDNPSFYVGDGGPKADDVRPHFTKPNIYYLGSHQGCSCGFREEYYEYDDPDEAAAIDKNHQKLAEFLTRTLNSQDNVELYFCWDGDEKLPTDTRRQITVREITNPDFFFNLNELIVVNAR